MGGAVFKLVSKKGKDKFSEQRYESLLDIPARDIDGNYINKLEDILHGKRCILVVNVASKWGLTDKHYTQFVRLYKEYRDQGFEILAFPCNQFMNQEPGTHEEIKKFIRDLYGGEWPIFEKIEVNGQNSHDVFKFLRMNSELHDREKKEVKEIPWNFAKFLVD